MTEIEKIAYAKTFIDKLANGINPLDDTPIPESDITNNVRLSRCFSYVSEILQQTIDIKNKNERKLTRVPFSITSAELSSIKYSKKPISLTSLRKKINLAVDLDAKNMSPLQYRQVIQWLLNIGMLDKRKFAQKKQIQKRHNEHQKESAGKDS